MKYIIAAIGFICSLSTYLLGAALPHQWVKVFEPADSGYDFRYFMAKDGVIWALPGLARSNDAGISWQQLEGMENHDDVAMVDSGFGLATFNRSSSIEVSIDGGKTWGNMHSKPEEDDLPAILRFFNRREGIGVGDFIYKTKDGGKTWRVVYNKKETLASYTPQNMFFLDEKRGWVVIDKGLVASTADGGETWREHSAISTPWPRCIQFVDRNHGWLLSNDFDEEHPTGRVLLARSTNGGAAWGRIYEIEISTASMINTFFFKNPDEGWMAGPGKLFHTRDGGRTWAEMEAAPSSKADSVALFYGRVKSEEYLLFATDEPQAEPHTEKDEYDGRVHYHDFGAIYRLSLDKNR